MFENLEQRRMFSVSAFALFGTLYVRGDDADNGISVERSGADVVVKQNVTGGHDGYVEFFRTPDSSVSSIRIYAYGGNDIVTISSDVTKYAVIYGGRGADYLEGGGGLNHLWGHGNTPGDPDNDPATDDGAADVLVSGKGNTVSYGQKGNDILITDNNIVSGLDAMWGGEGNDTFYIEGHGINAAHAIGEAGQDTFIPSQFATQQAFFYGGDGRDRVTYRDWTAAVYVRPDGIAPGATLSGLRSGTRLDYIQTDVESVEGTEYGDLFSGTDGSNIFYGLGGNDLMFGNGGDDILYGGTGDDSIYGQTGNDQLIGGDGNDVIYGGAGDDVVYGNQGMDDIHGDDGDDQLFGQEDGDWIYGDAGNDLLVGGEGSDYLVSHDGVFCNDRIYGDNLDGSGGGGGSYDVAYVDSFWFGVGDSYSGVESVWS
jgi:Ca2+-binding RTX toxin-like protein